MRDDVRSKVLELVKAEKKATDGVWESTQGFIHIENHVVATAGDKDAEFIALARNNTPAIVQAYLDADTLLGIGEVTNFVQWCHEEMRRLRPTGPCAQSIYTTSGQAAFDQKYPTMSHALSAYREQHTNQLTR